MSKVRVVKECSDGGGDPSGVGYGKVVLEYCQSVVTVP